jgi:LytS/YehU family sensor histidine kinase
LTQVPPDRRIPREVLSLVAGLWAVGAAAMVATVLGGTLEGLAVNVERALAMSVVGAALSLAIWGASATAGGPRWKIALLALGVVVATGVHTAIDLQAGVLLRRVAGEGEIHRRIISDSPLRGEVMRLIAETHIVIYAALYGFFALAATMLRWSAEAKTREAQLAAARTEAVSAQLAMLRHQLNPHFIFNTLNAIGSLVVTGRNAEAEEMIDRLSGFLRASLGADVQPFATLDDEVATLEAYLEIEAVRFGERLKVSWDIAADLGQACLPSFLLQPLVENAIKHAVSPALRPVEVRIAARREGGELVLSVEDTGAGPGSEPAAAGTGTGLRNVRERLALLYGARASLQTGRLGEGFAVRARLPLQLTAQAAAA